MSEVFNWGILAPGNIAEKFAESVSSMNDTVIKAIGSRTREKAEVFAEKWSVERAYGSYRELVNDPDVHAVYISSPHRFHSGHILLALEAGKHVLCEKPITVNASELKSLIKVAGEKKLFLMEAMWSRFIPTYQKLKKEWLADGRLGRIKRIEADFSFSAQYDPHSRLFDPELAGGALLDVGIYPLTLAYWIMGRKPDRMSSLCGKAETGVDSSGTVLLQWDTGETAVLNMGVDVRGPRSAVILGTEGMIEMPMPFYGGEKIIFRNEKGEDIFEKKHIKNGFDYQIKEVIRCVREGLIQSPDHPWSGNIEVMEIMDEIRAGWEIKYPFE